MGWWERRQENSGRWDESFSGMSDQEVVDAHIQGEIADSLLWFTAIDGKHTKKSIQEVCRGTLLELGLKMLDTTDEDKILNLVWNDETKKALEQVINTYYGKEQDRMRLAVEIAKKATGKIFNALKEIAPKKYVSEIKKDIEDGIDENDANYLVRNIREQSHPKTPKTDQKKYLSFDINVAYYFSDSKKIELFRDGMRKVAQRLSANTDAQAVLIESWIVQQRPDLVKQMGFTIQDENLHRKTRMPGRIAIMQRDDFIKKWGGRNS